MQQINLNAGERIDDLQLAGLKLIQNPKQFCFGVDAVLLTHYALSGIKKGAKVLDLCSGNGIIPVLLSHKSAASQIIGLEIQEGAADLAARSVKLNGLETKISIICGDLKDAVKLFGRSSFNNITCNPPYKEAGTGLVNSDDARTIARHEIKCTLEDIIRISAALLKPGGKLCMVHRPERLADLLCTMRQYQMEPKRLRFVHPSSGKTATMILAEAARQGRPKLFLDKPLYIYEETGTYTEEVNRIYER